MIVLAAITTVMKNAARVRLNNGTIDGEVQTVSVSFPGLNKIGFDADKVLNVAEKLEDCLSKEVYDVQHIQTSTLARDE